MGEAGALDGFDGPIAIDRGLNFGSTVFGVRPAVPHRTYCSRNEYGVRTMTHDLGARARCTVYDSNEYRVSAKKMRTPLAGNHIRYLAKLRCHIAERASADVY